MDIMREKITKSEESSPRRSVLIYLAMAIDVVTEQRRLLPSVRHDVDPAFVVRYNFKRLLVTHSKDCPTGPRKSI